MEVEVEEKDESLKVNCLDQEVIELSKNMKKAKGLPNSRRDAVKKRTSIGDSVRSRPKNKHKKRNWKKYRGQGK